MIIKDLTGQRFGRLLVMKRVGSSRHGTKWLCKCDCGNEKVLLQNNLSNGTTKSCGCLRTDVIRKRLRKNIEGMRFGLLTAIKPVEKPDNRPITNGTYWLCKCDCGNETIVHISHLGKNTNSCGCLTHKGKGVVTAENSVIHQYKNSSKYRGLDMELTNNEILNLVRQPCFYCGGMDYKSNNKQDKEFFPLNGIDRIDSSKGYVLNNVVPCCGRCNEAKMNISINEFYNWIDKVYNHIHFGK